MPVAAFILECMAGIVGIRSLDDAALMVGARRSAMDELAAATAEADKVLVF